MKHIFCLLTFFIIQQACSQKPAGYVNASNEEFKRMMNVPNTVVLDVRTPQEYAEGHIPGSVLINIYDQDFSTRISRLDKSKTYLVYCAVGGRSAKASQLLLENKVAGVYNLAGGIKEWTGEIEK
jgi:rhodanese-related sulfurtransferase